jgi:hypothetical protein
MTDGRSQDAAVEVYLPSVARPLGLLYVQPAALSCRQKCGKSKSKSRATAATAALFPRALVRMRAIQQNLK